MITAEAYYEFISVEYRSGFYELTYSKDGEEKTTILTKRKLAELLDKQIVTVNDVEYICLYVEDTNYLNLVKLVHFLEVGVYWPYVLRKIIEKKMKDLDKALIFVKTLKNDFIALQNGQWEPDDASIEASIDVCNLAIEILEKHSCKEN